MSHDVCGGDTEAGEFPELVHTAIEAVDCRGLAEF